MKDKFSIPNIEESREIPMKTRMQMIETLLYSVALDAEAMSDAMDKLSVEGTSTLTLSLKDDFALEFRHILKRLFWGDYNQPHAEDFYFGLIPSKWLRQYQLAADMREQSQDSTPDKESKPSVYEVYVQNKRTN